MTFTKEVKDALEDVSLLVIEADQKRYEAQLHSLARLDAARLKTLLNEPHKFNQTYGCCGFAAITMSLLQHSRPKFLELCKVAYAPDQKPHRPGALKHLVSYKTHIPPAPDPAGGPKPDPYKPLHLRKRLAWRQATLDWGGRHQLDLVVCVALMIIFKEHAKSQVVLQGQSFPPLWEDCIRFSRHFDEFEPLLKNQKDDIKANRAKFPTTLTLQKGDCALTKEALTYLLRFVFKDIFEIPIALKGDAKGKGTDVIADKDFADVATSVRSAAEAGGPAPAAWKTLLAKAQTSFFDHYKAADDAESLGAILGFASIEKDPALFAPFGHIVHWVYVPPHQTSGAQPRASNASSLVIWTYGRAWTLPEFAARYPTFIPKWALFHFTAA